MRPCRRFELEAGIEAGRTFIDGLKLLSSATHSLLDEAAQLANGVSPGYVRLSVGPAHIDDILADLEPALSAAGA